MSWNVNLARKKNDDSKGDPQFPREDEERTAGKKDLEKRSGERRMWNAGLRCGWRKMEAAAEMDEDKWSVSERTITIGSVAQLGERRSLAGELTVSCARPAADG